MTTTESADQYHIATTLDVDPDINYFSWKLNVEDVAAGAATLIEPTGLLTTVMSDAQWNAYPDNITITPAQGNTQATTTITPRPVEPKHKTIAAGMTGPQIAVIKYGNDRHETWHNAKEKLKASIIRSLGPTLAGTVGPSPLGFKVMNMRDIITKVEAKYATVDWTSLNKMDDIMMTPLDNIANLDQHLARLTRHINMSVAAGFEVEEHRRVKMFRQSVQHHPQIARTLASFDEAHPNPKTHTYAQITAHVGTQLPPILSAAGAGVTGKAFHAGPVNHEQLHAELLVAYAALQAKTQNPATTKRPSGAAKRARTRDNKRARGEGSTAKAEAKTCDSYCR